MSNHANHRRDHDKVQDHGPTWESHTPAAGCNSTHVARTRSKWKRIGSRAERRTDGHSLGGYRGGVKRPVDDSEEDLHLLERLVT